MLDYLASSLLDASVTAFQLSRSILMKLGSLQALAVAAPFLSAASAQCPDYTSYSQTPQGIPSNGTLGLPFMRPDPACRTFNSTFVETVISDMKARLKDPDIARLFENTFPNTLDTTVRYYNKAENLAFIITGDITAQWLRDTANQFAHYHSLLGKDPELADLVKAVINNEARYVAEYPYCGAFQPPPESGLAPSHNDWADGVTVNPPVNNQTVFECKYEIDSLCGFLKLSRSYFNATQDASFMNENCKTCLAISVNLSAHDWQGFNAINQIFRVINEQSQPSFDENFNFISFYNWTGGNGALSPAVPNGGNGEPKAYTGMVGTHHRPSDDLIISFTAFLTPANAMLSVELTHLADILDAAGQGQNISQSAREWSTRIHDAIWNTTIVDNIFAYETNGFGARYVMDDANVPSLLSLPYLGFLDKNDEAFVKTRDLLLSGRNPYFAAGKNFSGVGGPHVDAWHPWPMSQISAIFGTDDDAEILTRLYTIVNNTAGLGLIHESQSIYDASSYTRSWFAWANSYFAEMLLDLADRKPGLIFTTDERYIENLAFIITGDITAQWLRRVTRNNFAPYHVLLGKDSELTDLLILCSCIQIYVLRIHHFVRPVDDAFECKYEIDTLCGFLKTSRFYFNATRGASFMNKNWFNAIHQVFRVIDEQSSLLLMKASICEPRAYTGMAGAHHRPSDDSTFLTPANAMLSVELNHPGGILDAAGLGEILKQSALESENS
ncbi:hypothetical protein D9758_001236 [Tetrapyrgos nigripes]|uniref:Uncharacterized protein n=1 Tax=Tetrapyrgos nigripes TaxID=182062 RepID=A0A8H5GRI6_9AGAR|nr:hypothetical protein D9758_001236 [Tetrapyrgos nigripes]